MIAIHPRKNSFSDRWIKYCETHKINYKFVDCYANDILEQLKGCKGLLWHWSHSDHRDQIFARQLIYAVDKIGVKVFPDPNTSWLFDDKIGQRYLLAAIEAPLVKTYIFYSKNEALNWIGTTTFPKVFKLSGGAASTNVMLAKTPAQARRLTRKAFGKGFAYHRAWPKIRDRLWVLKRDKDIAAFKGVIKGIGSLALKKNSFSLLHRQKGYAYFQDFIPNYEYDDRILIVGNKGMTARRYVRKNDFRASGSGVIKRDKGLWNLEAVEIAFQVSKQIKAQSLAFDFIYDEKNKPLIVEISYCFPPYGFDKCPGYFDEDMNWHDAQVDAPIFILQDFLQSL